MSVATEISRIQTNRNTIRTKLVELGMASNTANLDALAEAIEGIVNRGAVSVEILEGTTYTIPAGYHNGSGTVKAMTDTTGEAEKYKTQTKTVTPTKSKQNISPDTGYYALESVTVNAIPDNYQDVSSVTAAAGDVLTGKVFVTADGTVVTGNMVNNGAVSKTLDVTTITYTIPKGYHSGSGKVTIALEEKTVTPTKSAQTITPTSGKVLSKVTVNPIPWTYLDVTDATAQASHILEGETAYSMVDPDPDIDDDEEPTKIVGTMPNNGAVTQSLNTGTTSYTIPAGYHSGSGKVSITTETKSATPTKSSQDITPTSGKVLSKVTVAAIPAAYQDVTGVTATAANVLDGKYIVTSDGTKVEGTMPNKGAVTASLNTSTTSYTIPAGYHNGSGKVSITTETKSATPTKSAQTITPTSGKVLSSVSVAAIPAAYQDVTGVTAGAADVLNGKVIVNASGTQVTGSMANNGAVSKTLSFTREGTSYTIPAGYHNGSGKVTVSPIPDEYQDVSDATVTEGEILAGVTAYGMQDSGDYGKITGTMPNRGAVTQSLNTSTTSYTIPNGYHNGSGKVSITTETKSATPTKSAQNITPTSGKVLSKVTVAAIPAAYQDVTSVTAAAGDVLTGKAIVNSSGTKVTGTMANNGSVTTTIDGLTTTSATIPAGYTTGGTVSLTSDIEEALAAI